MKKPTHLRDLGVTPALFEAMAAAHESNPKQLKLNKKLIRKEIKTQKKGKHLIKGVR